MRFLALLLALLCVSGVSAYDEDFIRGDCNSDGVIDWSDVIFLNNAMEYGDPYPSCFDACDVNDSGWIDQNDRNWLINWLAYDLFPPAAPFPGCGQDPTPGDPFDCDFSGCS